MTKYKIIILGVLFPLSFATHAKDNIATGKMIGDTCAACHGTFGKSKNEYMPVLAGLPKSSIEKSLLDYKNDNRKSVVMDRIAKGYSDEEIKRVSEYFSQIK